MSRSRHPACPYGKGCPVCGDAGEHRRGREAVLGQDDLVEGLAEAADITFDDGMSYDCQERGWCDYCMGEPLRNVACDYTPPKLFELDVGLWYRLSHAVMR